MSQPSQKDTVLVSVKAALPPCIHAAATLVRE
jgi:hypothetical protein